MRSEKDALLENLRPPDSADADDALALGTGDLAGGDRHLAGGDRELAPQLTLASSSEEGGGGAPPGRGERGAAAGREELEDELEELEERLERSETHRREVARKLGKERKHQQNLLNQFETEVELLTEKVPPCVWMACQMRALCAWMACQMRAPCVWMACQMRAPCAWMACQMRALCAWMACQMRAPCAWMARVSSRRWSGWRASAADACRRPLLS